MKAIEITRPGAPEVLELREVPEPHLGSAEVLVAVKATALNRADILQRMGRYPAPEGVSATIPGLEFAGVVSACGESVRRWQPGDRVMGLLAGGGYAEKVACHEGLVMAIPEGLGFAEAAAIPEAFLTAFDALILQGGLRAGESVLVHAAASGVGIAALQLARAAGAAQVIGTGRNPAKLALLARHGATSTVLTGEQSFAEQVLEATAGRGVDVVIDLVGAAAWEGNLQCLASRGRIIIVGLVGGAKVQANLGKLLERRATVVGTVLRTRPLSEKLLLVEEFTRRVLPGFATGRYGAIVDRVLPLADAAEGHRVMEANANVGKIVLEVAGS